MEVGGGVGGCVYEGGGTSFHFSAHLQQNMEVLRLGTLASRVSQFIAFTCQKC